MAFSVAEIIDIMVQAGLPPSENLALPPRRPEFSPVPVCLSEPIKNQLAGQYPKGLYGHQSRGIEAALTKQDICLATQTASGKSLVFMAVAAEFIARRPHARILAIYPVKALIKDQLEKWGTFLNPFGYKVGFIDGSVPTAARAGVLRSSHVVAMTPDVAHAWLMSHLNDSEVKNFLGNLALLVLDEAHVYDGAFGTNMAYFLRRFSAVSSEFRLICSTATIGAPRDFMTQLTGREMLVFDDKDDTSALPEKTLVLAPSSKKGGFDKAVQLLVALAKSGKARFLAFGDSRKAVETIVGAVLRHGAPIDDPDQGGNESPNEEEAPIKDWPKLEHVLPYRAGYEASDRDAIQNALTAGTLAGVVSTSALELGLDIGDLDVVVLLNTPPSIKAFKQRIGRAGRRREAICILIDDQGVMTPLAEYAQRPPEPSWLYLDNRYIQYANALCAAVEMQARGKRSAAQMAFPGLPETFARLLENELNPTAAVDQDLYELKQRAQGNPHYEFPIRSAAEPNFEVEGPHGLKLGSLSYSQALREAYPGAVYYYMARPFRVGALEYKKGEIKAHHSKRFTTKPLSETMAFPDFRNGVLASWQSPEGFIAEVELQISERVKGFIEQRGQNKSPHEYGPGSSFSQKPLQRFFRTTGACWAFPGKIDRSEDVAEAVLKAFAFTCDVHERDLGVALFHSNQGLLSAEPVKGTVVFDATNGSLRLTERLAREFLDVIESAVSLSAAGSQLQKDLVALRDLVSEVKRSEKLTPTEPATAGDWIRVIDRNQRAMYITGEAPTEVQVLDFRYTPHGLMYQLEPLKAPGFSVQVAEGKRGSTEKAVAPVSQGKWMVLATVVQPLPGTSRMIKYNVVTGEETSD